VDAALVDSQRYTSVSIMCDWKRGSVKDKMVRQTARNTGQARNGLSPVDARYYGYCHLSVNNSRGLAATRLPSEGCCSKLCCLVRPTGHCEMSSR